jgi:large subunit ribosomal protein L10
MPNAEKVDKVEALKGRIEGANALLLAEYRGLTVHDATELRRSLSEAARFSVVKNTLMQRAADQAGIAELEGLLSGPTAVAFVDGDVVAAAKKVVDAAKKFPSLVLKGAYLDGKVLDAAQAQALATLESRDVMLSKIAGMLKTEMARAASMFQTLQSRFVGLLEAYRDTLPAGAGDTEATEAEDAPAAEADKASVTEAPVAEAGAEEASEAEVSSEAEASSEAEVSSDAENPTEEPSGDDSTEAKPSETTEEG